MLGNIHSCQNNVVPVKFSKMNSRFIFCNSVFRSCNVLVEKKSASPVYMQICNKSYSLLWTNKNKTFCLIGLRNFSGARYVYSWWRDEIFIMHDLPPSFSSSRRVGKPSGKTANNTTKIPRVRMSPYQISTVHIIL